MLTLLNYLDIVGAVTGILGAILVGRVDRKGYLGFMLSNTAFVLLALLQHNYGLVILSIIAFSLNIYYYRKWKKRDLLEHKVSKYAIIQILEEDVK